MLEPPVPALDAREPPGAMEALLAGYAEGSLDPYTHTLVESHLILSDVNRETVRAMEEAIGDELDAIEPQPFRRSARDEVLGAIYAGGWYGRPRPPKIDPDVPEPLEKLIRARLDDLSWTFAGFGVREHVLFADDSLRASFYRVKAGRRLPQHTHTGLEATLVLKGAFEDATGRYVRGDVALADATVDHQPVADPSGPCVCFAVVQGPLRLSGPIGRLVQRIFGA